MCPIIMDHPVYRVRRIIELIDLLKVAFFLEKQVSCRQNTGASQNAYYLILKAEKLKV